MSVDDIPPALRDQLAPWQLVVLRRMIDEPWVDPVPDADTCNEIAAAYLPGASGRVRFRSTAGARASVDGWPKAGELRRLFIKPPESFIFIKPPE